MTKKELEELISQQARYILYLESRISGLNTELEDVDEQRRTWYNEAEKRRTEVRLLQDKYNILKTKV